MKQRRIMALSAAIVLAFAIAAPADAQFGNLVKKVKKSAEQSVKRKVEDAKKDAKRKAESTADETLDKGKKDVGVRVSEKTGLPVSSSFGGKGSSLETLYKQNFKPSAGALKADPDAANDDVWRRSTRSFAQIHAAYEHLDP